MTTYGKYLSEEFRQGGIVVWESRTPFSVRRPKSKPSPDTTVETIEQLFMKALQMASGSGVPSYIPAAKTDDGYVPLTWDAVADLSEEAQDQMTIFPLELLVKRLVWEQDEELLPPDLAKKLFSPADAPEAPPLTASFATAAGLMLEQTGSRKRRRRT
jgi:hypothetical protein